MAFKIAAVGNDGQNVNTYTSKRDGNTMYVFAVKVEGEGDTVFEVSRASDSPPEVGAEYEKMDRKEGTGYRPTLSKPIQGSGGYRPGGGRGRAGGGYSPEDIAAMRRSGAQDRALKFCEVRGLFPIIAEGDTAQGLAEVEHGADFRRLVEWFESHVQEAVEAVKKEASS